MSVRARRCFYSDGSGGALTGERGLANAFINYFLQVNVVAMYASSYVLLMAAIDRYVSICHPLTNQTLSPKRIHLMILLAWGLAIVFSIPQLIIFRLQDVSNASQIAAN